MAFNCTIGLHKWDGCKCTECGEIRDTHHEWSNDFENCLKCGKPHAHSCKTVNLSKSPGDYILLADECTVCGKTMHLRLKSTSKQEEAIESAISSAKQVPCPKCKSGLCYEFEKYPLYLHTEKYHTPDGFTSITDIFFYETATHCIDCGFSKSDSSRKGNHKGTVDGWK